MPNLHIIIGDANTRKSSLLRCLTGVGSGNASRYMDVAQTSGKVMQVYCILSALQENYKPLLPIEFIEHVNALPHQPTDVAFTLRVNARGGYPHCLVYMNAFAAAGWPIVSVALLGSSACALGGQVSAANVYAAPGSAQQPTNLTASVVRSAWTWM